MPNIKTLLEVEIADKFKKLSEMEAGTQEYEAAANSITKLMDRYIEMEKHDDEIHDKSESRNEEKKGRLFQNIISVTGIVVPTLVTIWGTVKSFEFEKEGTITTIMGRGFINKLLPKK